MTDTSTEYKAGWAAAMEHAASMHPGCTMVDPKCVSPEAHRCPYPAAGCTSPDCNISAARREQRAYERGHRDATEKAAAGIALRDRVLAGLDDRASMWEAEMASGSLTNAPWAVSELRDGLAEWLNGREGE